MLELLVFSYKTKSFTPITNKLFRAIRCEYT